MFTGIIKAVGKVLNAYKEKGGLFVEIGIPKGWKIKAGESISVNGVCSTVSKVNKVNKVCKDTFMVEYMPETIKKTAAGNFRKGTEVNLERSLRVGDLLDGHIVQGHVDCVGKVVGVRKVKSSKVVKIQVPKEFMKFLAPKGSVTVDGVSLTIVESKKNWFSVSLVSYTLENTDLGNIRIGEKVNIEVDAMAKYIFNILKYAKR
jgi:riboflavin synthase